MLLAGLRLKLCYKNEMVIYGWISLVEVVALRVKKNKTQSKKDTKQEKHKARKTQSKKNTDLLEIGLLPLV